MNNSYENQNFSYCGGIPDYYDYSQQNQQKCVQNDGDYYYVSDFTPEVYGHAVNALAYDTTHNSMYVASTTQTMSPTGSMRYGKTSHRASLLLTYSRTPSKELYLYSSIAGHQEASIYTLQSIYKSIYGISNVDTVLRGVGVDDRSAVRRRNNFYPPNHAYQPSYGGGEVAENLDAYQNRGNRHQRGHMGITAILPLDNGFIASVSPSAVRVHTHGGLQIYDHPNISGMISGTIHPNCMSSGGSTSNGNTVATHITVGGLSGDDSTNKSSIHCLDIWQGLRTVYSRSFKEASSGDDKVGVTCMATSHTRGSIIAGCTDGNIRLMDGSLQEFATIRSHLGGVSNLAVSPDGNLVATTGFSSKAKPSSKDTCSALYAFADQIVKIYDLRFLGRGGMSHPFSGVPRHVCFIPDVEGCSSNRFLVASGKRGGGGGVQIITPFETQNENNIKFFLPPMEQDESITAMSLPEENGDELAFGTSLGLVKRFALFGYDKKTKNLPSQSDGKIDLAMPSFYPTDPAVSMDPTLLHGNPEIRNGITDELRCLFSSYILKSYPTITSIGESFEDAMTTFGKIAGIPILTDKRRIINQRLLKEATMGEKEYMLVVPTSTINIDLLINHSFPSKRYGEKESRVIQNPNKILHNDSLSSLCYEDGWNGEGKQQYGGPQKNSAKTLSNGIPYRYQLHFKAPGSFEDPNYNDTGLFPGWDYGSTMPNAWVSPVILLFYFIPEIRNSVLPSQFNEKSLGTTAYNMALAPELGFVFHQIESLSRYGLLYPSKELQKTDEKQYKQIGSWKPSNFLSFLSTMGEASQMAVLDDSPAAVDLPRRPEFFYRFMAYHLDKELLLLSTLSSSKNSSSKPKSIESLNGLGFLSSNQFIESKCQPTQASTRALTLDLNYDIFRPGDKKQPVRFGELLLHSLCRETRLRAWNDKSRAYETIIQRKIATSLPQILTLSCACAGRKEQDGLWVWRTDTDGRPWLAETIEVSLLEDGNVEVIEWYKTKNGNFDSTTFRGKSSIPIEVSKLVSKVSSKKKYRYRLESVLSFIKDKNAGHHVLHARVNPDYKRMVLKNQAEEARKLAEEDTILKTPEERELHNLLPSSKISAEQFLKRAENVEQELLFVEEKDHEEPENQDSSLINDDWILFNGTKVSKTVSDDARAFHAPFKEPVLVVFQAVDEKSITLRESGKTRSEVKKIPKLLPASVMNPSSLSLKPGHILTAEFLQKFKAGRPVAFDAEFVSVQEEDSELNESGQKNVLRDTRHALGRISIFDCPTETVVVDDHVLPREQVADYLTRFSGLVPDDLDPNRSNHRIISTRGAYLQLRYLLDQGCIFVGHGLKQDFSTVNLIVPPNQILDTVKIFHQSGRRYVSLRFLFNFVFGRDMQQDTHDSVEDAQAAFELYRKAMEWKREGIWEQRIKELYELGGKTSWKLASS